MGLFNFLTRRSKGDAESDRSLRLKVGNPLAAASGSSVAVHSPLQRASLERLRQAAANDNRRLKLTNSSKPFLLGVRSERPSTANSEGGSGLARPSYSRTQVYSVADSDITSIAPSNQSITASRSRLSTRTSGYIDLLDAQGGLRPYDFRARVRAAGVRDYGEDVAERNMGENGVNVRSAASQDFYEQKKRISVATLSNMSYVREAGGSIHAGSEAGDINGSVYSATRPFSSLSMEPRQETVAGKVQTRGHLKCESSDSTFKDMTEPRGSRTTQTSHMQDQPGHVRSRGISTHTRPWISTEQPVAGQTRNDRWESRHLRASSRDRSLSPPSIPRYRPDSSMTTMHEENERPHFDSHPNSGRDDFHNDDIEGGHYSDEEQSEYNGSQPRRTHQPFNSSVAPAASPQYHPDWQSAIQRAVEESLSKLPLSADLKALLELSQSGMPLDDILQKGPLRRSSLYQGSTLSTTPTTDFSDYASSNTGRPQSRHTATTSIDSSARVDFYHKGGLGTLEDKSFAVDHNQGSPYLTPVDIDEELMTPEKAIAPSSQPSLAACCSNRSIREQGVMEGEEDDRLTPDFSDADSFTEKRQQALGDDENNFFNEEGFGDISNNLPGIVGFKEPRKCMMCFVLANLQGASAQTGPCTHDGVMTRKQRLRALGYDYDSEESEPGRDSTPPKVRPRTKKLTVGSSGGLRRLKLVDDRIDEASEEERGEGSLGKHWPELRRKAKFPNGRMSYPVLPQEHVAGNMMDRNGRRAPDSKLRSAY
ncbi:hypothetical protein ED733_002749 [Metarhizium rileyi]|uniref:Uncharacterized protein n=1 Tax=Metarhizium rileyi (strain RCEF 4871) TaxID=1649241 RepID=A0A5C6GIX4_METRR|nr:hypothetical protein ED733_002749 [Metarhizium rileyi]